MKKSVFCFLIFLASCNNNDKHVDVEIKTAGQQGIEKELESAIIKYPDSFLLKENLFQYYRDSGNYSKAIGLVDHELTKDSMNARLWNIKAILHFEDADTINAIRSFEKAVSIIPDIQYLISLGTLYAQTKNSRALKMADLLLETNKANSEKEAYYIKGMYHSYHHEKLKAIEYFDKCLSISYTFMDGYREKSIALYDLGKYADALTVLDKAITLQNSFDEGYYYSGKCLEKMNRIPEAIQSYKNALVIDPDYMEAKEALTRLGVNQDQL